MIATLVYVDVKPDCVEAFKKITEYNHNNTRKEAKNVRFDVLQSSADPTQFVLYEVFEDGGAVCCHQYHFRAEQKLRSLLCGGRTGFGSVFDCARSKCEVVGRPAIFGEYCQLF